MRMIDYGAQAEELVDSVTSFFALPKLDAYRCAFGLNKLTDIGIEELSQMHPKLPQLFKLCIQRAEGTNQAMLLQASVKLHKAKPLYLNFEWSDVRDKTVLQEILQIKKITADMAFVHLCVLRVHEDRELGSHHVVKKLNTHTILMRHWFDAQGPGCWDKLLVANGLGLTENLVATVFDDTLAVETVPMITSVEL